MEKSKITVNIQGGGFENLQKMEAGVFRVAQMLRDRIEAATAQREITVKVIIVTCEDEHLGAKNLIYEIVISFWGVEKKFRYSFYAAAYSHSKGEMDNKLGKFDTHLRSVLGFLITELTRESSVRTRQGAEILSCANHMKHYAEAQSAVSG